MSMLSKVFCVCESILHDTLQNGLLGEQALAQHLFDDILARFYASGD